MVDCHQRNAAHLVVTDAQQQQDAQLAGMTQERRLELLSWLIKHHPSCLWRINNNKSTPLCVACHFGNTEVVATLLKKANFVRMMEQTRAGMLHHQPWHGH